MLVSTLHTLRPAHYNTNDVVRDVIPVLDACVLLQVVSLGMHCSSQLACPQCLMYMLYSLTPPPHVYCGVVICFVAGQYFVDLRIPRLFAHVNAILECCLRIAKL